MRNIILLLLSFLAHVWQGFSQDINSLLEESAPAEKEFTIATFKGTRLINSHTIETQGKRVLEYRISHRFGTLNSGVYDFFGLDGGATIRMGLEYCVDGRLNVGLGRTNVDKTYDGYAKYRILRQTTKNENPISITWVSSMYYATIKDPNISVNGFDRYHPATNRMSFCHQLLIARKFTERISFQLAPAMVHFNLVEKMSHKNDLFSLGFVGRVKLTKRLAITAEYIQRLTTDYNDQKDAAGNTLYYNSLAIGVDIETGGHIFQIHLANSAGLIENQFIPYTQSDWKTGGIRIGFNISRVFSL